MYCSFTQIITHLLLVCQTLSHTGWKQLAKLPKYIYKLFNSTMSTDLYYCTTLCKSISITWSESFSPDFLPFLCMAVHAILMWLLLMLLFPQKLSFSFFFDILVSSPAFGDANKYIERKIKVARIRQKVIITWTATHRNRKIGMKTILKVVSSRNLGF